jgi:hypothetical protein
VQCTKIVAFLPLIFTPVNVFMLDFQGFYAFRPDVRICEMIYVAMQQSGVASAF